MARPPIDRCEVDAVLELCRTETENDCDYFYSYELDAEGRLKNLFWADTGSGIDSRIRDHGDVVVFDTSCRTNKHGVHFVPFVGLSRHRTPIVLGCGITSDQSLDSLVWLLRAFTESTAQKMPASVITDASDAVAGAVKAVFPGCNHRFCSGHVEQGIVEHLRGSPAAQTEFRALMCDRACSPAAFRDRWHGFMARHRTAANQRWLDAMYAKWKMWAAASVHGKFFLGMANDQRTECLATALHKDLHEGMSLVDLWRHADACADALRGNVAVLDHQAAAVSRLVLTTEHRRMEEHAARLFTPANIYLVREEIRMLSSFKVVIESRIPDAKSGDMIYIYGMAFNQRRGVIFNVRRSGDVIKCSCRKMERDGLPCRHIFCVMRYTSMVEIPACCALRRMRRLKTLERPLDAKMERLEEMKDLGRQVFGQASEDAQEFEEIKEFFQTWLEEKERRRGSGAVGDATDVESSTAVAKRIKLFDD